MEERNISKTREGKIKGELTEKSLQKQKGGICLGGHYEHFLDAIRPVNTTLTRSRIKWNFQRNLFNFQRNLS